MSWPDMTKELPEKVNIAAVGTDRDAFVVGILITIAEHFSKEKDLSRFMTRALAIANDLCDDKAYTGKIDNRMIQTIMHYLEPEVDSTTEH